MEEVNLLSSYRKKSVNKSLMHSLHCFRIIPQLFGNTAILLNILVSKHLQ